MAKRPLSPHVLALVAERFKALAEPARLEILNALRQGELTVGGLVEATGMGQANVSKHLALPLSLGVVSRRKEGLFAYYALADSRVFQLCDMMCARIESETAARRRALGA